MNCESCGRPSDRDICPHCWHEIMIDILGPDHTLVVATDQITHESAYILLGY